jgi:hypothetical protein
MTLILYVIRLCRGVLAFLTIYSIIITGFAVLGGHTRVEDPTANFRHSFSGTTTNGNGLANALVKVNFAYAGFDASVDHSVFGLELILITECLQRFKRSSSMCFDNVWMTIPFNPIMYQNPVRTLKRFAPASLAVVFTLYMFANVAYFAASELSGCSLTCAHC